MLGLSDRDEEPLVHRTLHLAHPGLGPGLGLKGLRLDGEAPAMHTAFPLEIPRLRIVAKLSSLDGCLDLEQN